MTPPYYFDYAATTPVDPRVARKMMRYLTPTGVFGNPASNSHLFGHKAAKAVDNARMQVATCIGAEPAEIIWTSGATESNNLAIGGAVNAVGNQKRHVVVMKIEHKAVLDTVQQLVKEGCKVTYLNPQSNGLIDLDEFQAALQNDTVLASVMWVNNEIGVVQPIAEIGRICRAKGILFHVDAAQAPGKVRIDVNAAQVDLMSLCAHKVYGPKGIGALYVRRKPRIKLKAQVYGGGHERGLRSGTLATHQIVGMGEAFQLADEEFDEDNHRARMLFDKLLTGMRGIEAAYINGDIENRVAQNLNVSFDCVASESLIMAAKEIAISSGSACTSASVEPSHVLAALGVGELAYSSIRISTGRFTTESQVDFLIDLLQDKVNHLRELAPLWAQRKTPRRA